MAWATGWAGVDTRQFHSYNAFQHLLKAANAVKHPISEHNLIEQGIAVIAECLHDVEFLKLGGMRNCHADGDMCDLIVELVYSGAGSRMLAVEAKASGQPRSARAAINSLHRYIAQHAGLYGVFLAPYISRETGDICAREGIGYIDLAGNCRLTFDHVYIRKESATNPFAVKRDLRSVYSPKAARAVHALLNEVGRNWRVQELAAVAGISIGQASNVKRLLEDREWLSETPTGFRLTNPEALLMEWAEAGRPGAFVYEYYSFDSIATTEQRLAAVCDEQAVPYALTEFSGAARYAPVVRYQRASGYVMGNVADLADAMGLRKVESGANVRLLAPRDEGVLLGACKIAGVQIASPVRVYLDIRHLAGRGEEAGEALLANVIRPSWAAGDTGSLGGKP